MLKEQVKLEIIKKVQNLNFVKYAQLVKDFKLSLSSTKRYCKELSKSNKIRIVRGGIASNYNLELNNLSKQKINIKQKQIIAEKAVKKIKDFDVIFLDAGTSTIELAKKLPENKNIVVFTNNIDIISCIASKNIKTYLISGKINFNTLAITGSLAIETINKLKFNIAFIGCNGYDHEFLYTTNLDEAVFKKKVVDVSHISYFLADSSKKNKNLPYKIIKFKEANLIT